MIKFGRSNQISRAATAACALFLSVSAISVGAQSLPPCPTVNVSLLATIDTKRAKPGDVFRFKTLGAATFGTQTIAADTPGTGLIEVLDHSKSNGHSGYLVLDARYLKQADGSHVPVSFVPGTDGRSFADVRAGSSDAPGILGYIPYYVGTAAGIYNFFHHGKDAAVVAGTIMPLVIGDGIEEGTCSAPITGITSDYPGPHF